VDTGRPFGSGVPLVCWFSKRLHPVSVPGLVSTASWESPPAPNGSSDGCAVFSAVLARTRADGPLSTTRLESARVFRPGIYGIPRCSPWVSTRERSTCRRIARPTSGQSGKAGHDNSRRTRGEKKKKKPWFCRALTNRGTPRAERSLGGNNVDGRTTHVVRTAHSVLGELVRTVKLDLILRGGSSPRPDTPPTPIQLPPRYTHIHSNTATAGRHNLTDGSTRSGSGSKRALVAVEEQSRVGRNMSTRSLPHTHIHTPRGTRCPHGSTRSPPR